VTVPLTFPLMLALFVAGVVGGAINAAVGSGTLLTYPVLLAAGIPPVAANGSNTTGLSPGSFASAWAYRAEIAPRLRELRLPIATTVVAAALGALLVVRLPSTVFSTAVPFLVGTATVLIALQPLINRWTRNHELGGRHTLWPWTALVGVYGGYFGAGQGIMLMAVLGARYDRNPQVCNGAKNLLAACANVTAAAVFALSGSVVWLAALCLAFGAIPGGYIGGRAARRLPRSLLRGLVVAIGVGATAYLCVKLL